MTAPPRDEGGPTGDDLPADDPEALPVGEEGDPADEPWPKGFILTIVMVALYLGYRLVQGLVALWQWAT
ncbi:hypothetical protein BH24ACT7_BH24ACT7_10660 [soil metagenome]